MNKFVWLLLCLALAVAQTALAQTPAVAPAPVDPSKPAAPIKRASKDELVPFVKKAIDYFKANGEEKALADFIDTPGKFHDRDLYIMAYDDTGTCIAHGANKKLTGMNRVDEQDADGVYYIKERVDLMKTQPNYWQHYKFTDPLTHKILPKVAYCEVIDMSAPHRKVLCSGIYDVSN